MSTSNSKRVRVDRVGKYRLIKTLGEGTFGKVKLATNIETKEMVAMKIIDKVQVLRQNMGPQVKKEISIMKKLKHPHVIQVKEVLASSTKIFIIMEYIPRGELRKVLEENDGKKLGEDKARKYFRQMIQGLKYTHSQGVCHRDLKPENLLLDSDDNIKISDFGLSNFIDGRSSGSTEPSLLQTTCGTPYYVAPEVLNNKGYLGMAADVWSCGVILYVMLAGYFPFDAKSMPDLFHKIQRGKYECPAWFSEEVKDLLNQIIVKSPSDRVTLEEIQKNAWYNKGFESEAPQMYTPITVTDDQVAGAVSSTTLSHETEYAPASGAPTMNAFDLMNVVGGLALDNLFNYHKGSHASWKRFYHFESGLPVDKIVAGMKSVMHETGMTTLANETPDSMVFHVKRKGHHSELYVDIFMVLKTLHIVKFRRGEGDAIAYYKFMAETGPLISKVIGVDNQGPSGIVLAGAANAPDASDSAIPPIPAAASAASTCSAAASAASNDSAAASAASNDSAAASAASNDSLASNDSAAY